MSYDIRSSVTTGFVEYDGDRYEIREGTVSVGDYETAAALTDAFTHLQLPDGAPGAPDVADAESDGSDSDEGDDLEELDYSDLQQRAKENDIKANQSADDLIDALRNAEA